MSLAKGRRHGSPTVRRTLSDIAVAMLVVSGACRPELDDRTSRVDRLRVLAVRSEPAEAAPGASVRFAVLVGDASGTRRDLAPSLAFCSRRKALAESSKVSPSCLDDSAVERVDTSLVGVLPQGACGLFGPERAASADGQPSGRPADPDATGGYYQPGRVRLAVPTPETTIFEVRTTCGLPGATLEVVSNFGRRYRANQNPEITLTLDDRPLADAAEIEAAPGESLRFVVAWPSCEGGAPCGGAEPYVAFEPASRTLVNRREAMRVSWLATDGTWAEDRTGRDENDVGQRTENAWTAPTSTVGSPVTLWAVLRDTRGGVAFTSVRVRVR